MMIMTVVKQKQYASLQKLIARIDPDAFFVVSDADEVQGAGFTFHSGIVCTMNRM